LHIPKIGEVVLPLPTPPHIRKRKAANFIRHAEERARRVKEAEARKARVLAKRKEIEELKDLAVRLAMEQTGPSEPPPAGVRAEDDPLYTLPATTFTPQKSQAVLPSSPSALTPVSAVTQRTGCSSQQELNEVDGASIDPLSDPSHFVRFEMMSPGQVSTDADAAPDVRGGLGEIVTLQQVPSENGPQRMTDNPLPSISTLRLSQCSPHRFVSQTCVPPLRHGSLENKKRSAQAAGGSQQPLGQDIKPATADQQIVVSKLRKISDSLKSLLGQRPAKEHSASQQYLRAANRQARIIDNQFLSPNVHQRLSLPSGLFSQNEVNVVETKKSVIRRSLTPVWQKAESSQTRVVKAFRNLFRAEPESGRVEK
jgi:hypothetical protein